MPGRHSCAAMNVTAGDLLLSYNIVYYNGSTSGLTLTNSDTQGNTWRVIQTVTIPEVPRNDPADSVRTREKQRQRHDYGLGSE